MDIWDGAPHRVVPGVDFFPVAFTGEVEPVSEAEGDARLTTEKLTGVDVRIAEVNDGFNSFATRLVRIAETAGLTLRCWYTTAKGSVEHKSYRLSPDNITEYWVQVTSEVDEEIADVLS